MMATMTRSAAAIHTLSKADPQFAAFVRTLYGSNVDADAIWQDVYGVSKLAPDQSDLSTPGQQGQSNGGNWKRKLAIAGTVAGGVLAGRELVQNVPKLTDALKTGKGVLVPAGGIKGQGLVGGAKQLAQSPAGRVGVGGLALSSDVAATDELRQKNQNGMSKKAPAMRDMVDGRHKINRMLCPTDHPALRGKFPKEKKVGKAVGDQFNPRWNGSGPAPRPTAVPKNAYENWEKAGRTAVQGTKSVLRSPTGRVAVAATAAYEGKKAYDRHQDRKYGGDPYSYYGKNADPEVEWQGEFAKFDDDKQLAFGWASVVKLNGQPVVDRQGDLIEMDDIEKAAYDYVQRSRVGGGMHERTTDDQAIHLSDLVESFVVTDEKVEKMGLPPETPRGWWVGFKVNDDDAWGKVKKGEWTGFSIHGKGKRIEKSLDEAMGY